MIYLVMPIGSSHGWGVCGKYLTIELPRLSPLRLISSPITPDSAGDELDFFSVSQQLASPQEQAAVQAAATTGRPVEGCVLQCITSKMMLPILPGLRGRYTVGYTFFEENLPPQALENARRHFDHVAAGCSWCAEKLRALGLSDVSTVIQGIDPNLFEPSPRRRQHFCDRFVVFSGGKFELRKGQDVVIRAYKVLQDKYRDVMLVTAWHNLWDWSVATMKASPLIRFAPRSTDHVTMVKQVLADNGIDVSRTVNLATRPNATMARIYKNTDVGLFPNRCEGGTNLVLMEYMACGKPVIASFSSGHRDILTPQNSLRIEDLAALEVCQNDRPVALWDEPNLDETVAHLEYAYLHRDQMAAYGRQAGCDMATCTWQHTAAEFYKLVNRKHSSNPLGNLGNFAATPFINVSYGTQPLQTTELT